MRYLILSSLLFFTMNCSTKQNWQIKNISNPTEDNASLPRLYTDNTGTVFMSWIENNNEEASLLYSKLEKEKWSEPVKISQSDNWFINWADYPSIIAHNGKPVAAHWLRKVEGGTYAYNVEIASALNSWSNTITPHSDNTPTEHGFVSMVPSSDSTFMSIWLDGRNTAGNSHDDHAGASSISSAMTLRSALLGADLKIISESEIDNNVCDCCGTSMARIDQGFITAYRDRTKNEIRDIYIVKYKNGSWSTPISVNNDNWEIAACPVNGPAIAANDRLVAVAWYTGANDIPKIKIGLSNDEGDSFNESITIDNGNPLGRVDIEIMNDDNIIVSWLERNMEDRSKADLVAKIFSANGKVIREIELAEMSSSRRSGFPQISSYNGKIVAAWTDLSDKKTSIKTAILD